jgi:hypothetical protein
MGCWTRDRSSGSWNLGTFAVSASMKADTRSAVETEILGVVSDSGEPSSSS